MFKTKNGRVLDVEELDWSQASSILKPLVPDLVKIINGLGVNNEFKIYKAKYRFGARIFNKEGAFLPLKDGGKISFNDPSLPTEIIKQLGYTTGISNPLGMVVSKNCELYLPINQRIMPYMIVKPGEAFGLARILDNAIRSEPIKNNSNFFMWELTSGARSVFMLPKISDGIGHNKLKKAYGLVTEKPQFYQNHWSVFKEISQKTESNWYSEILFFSNTWIDFLKDPACSHLYGQFSKMHRASHKIWHNIPSWTATFNQIEQNKNLNIFPSYILDTAKHLFAIAANSAPGFKPALDEESLPLKLIQEVYVNSYGLTEYYPTVMEPVLFPDNDQSIYYSLNYPTLAQYNPEIIKGKTIITILDELQRVTSKYQSGILQDQSAIRVVSLNNAASAVEFNYYHSDPGKYKNIKNDISLASEDTRFTNNGSIETFSKHSSFLKGCVKLSPRNNTVDEVK